MKYTKIIALLLAASLVCGTAMCAVADEADLTAEYVITEIDDSEALAAEADEIFFAIAGADFRGNTRGAFVSDVVSFLKLSGEKPVAPDFKDVAPGRSDSGYIHSALVAGLISPGNNFRPDDIITADEAATIVLRAIGYGELAEYKGGWPLGYAQCAKDADLFYGTSSSAELSATDSKIIILNMLGARLIDTNYSTDKHRYTVGEKTFLESYYGISMHSAVVSETPVGGLDSAAEYAEGGKLTAGDKSFRVKDGDKTYSDLLGYNANIYYDENGYLVAAAKDSINKTVTVSDEYVEFDGGLKLMCAGEKRTTSYKLDEAYSLIYNGSASSRRLKEILAELDGKVELIDNDGDNTYEVVSVRDCFYVTVNTISKNGRVVYDKNTSDNLLDLSDEYANYSIKDGNTEIWINSLKAGDTLEVYPSENRKTIEAYLMKSSVSGTIDAMGEDTVTVGGKDYKMTDYFRNYYLEVIKPGNSGSFTLSSRGELINFSDYSANLAYGYVTGIKKESALSDTVQMRIFTADGKQDVFTLKDKVRVDGKSVNADDVYDIFFSGGSLQDQLITYSADDDDTLIAIDLAEITSAGDFGETSNPADSLKEYQFSQKSFYYKSGAEVMYPCFNVSSTTVFVIPNDLSDTEIYRVSDSSYFKDCDTYALKVYNVNEAGCASAVVYRTDEISPRISEYAPSFVVESIVSALNSEGDAQTKIYGWQEKKYVSYFLDDSISLYKKSGEKLGFGDIIRFYAENGEIKALACDFDANENVFARNNSADAAQFNVGNTSVNYQSGKAYSLAGGYVFMTNSDVDADDFALSGIRNFTLKTDNIAIIDLTAKTVKTGKAEDIRTYKNAHDSADFILLRQRMLNTSACFVYVR